MTDKIYSESVIVQGMSGRCYWVASFPTKELFIETCLFADGAECACNPRPEAVTTPDLKKVFCPWAKLWVE